MHRPLPDIHPGALPSLQFLKLTFPKLHAVLPASWGAAPDTLPRLSSLSLLHCADGPLPREWHRGFRRLQRFYMLCEPRCKEAAVGIGSSGGGGGGGAGPRLPPEWALGFPALNSLNLCGLGLRGPFPASWQHGFSNLTVL